MYMHAYTLKCDQSIHFSILKKGEKNTVFWGTLFILIKRKVFLPVMCISNEFNLKRAFEIMIIFKLLNRVAENNISINYLQKVKS